MLKAGKFNSDKSQRMLDNYERWFGHLKDKKVCLLELGVLHGGSLLMWQDYFKKGTIVGLDMEPVQLDAPAPRIKLYQGMQDDKILLEKMAKETAPNGFDIIIDDASHLAAPTREAFWYLFDNHLKKGGVYVIEDWGTGYWPIFADGKHYNDRRAQLAKRIKSKKVPSHEYGMVGFIKQLVDEVAMDDITDKRFGISPVRKSKIASIELQLSQATIFKR